ncbi:hypothetical protein P5673_025104 [Acropora cervicornis]|uniref:Uncharacterized protein n=1 Tax=Acropora cervicornis TaxID=6130 RepID=A0AAD9Q3D6_ACRCE|nr:hypothetical protein P5673_025104 [Acropora cervicornis]
MVAPKTLRVVIHQTFVLRPMTLPTTLGLTCYSCHEYIGSPSSCNNPSVINCESFYNSCLTVHATMEMFGMSFSTTWKNCSVSSMCDSNFLCNQLKDDPMMKSCSTTCCSGNLCNDQSHVGQGAILKVADKTGTIDLDSWENIISTVKEGKVYSVNSAQVRQWMDQNKLSSVFSSALTLDSRADTQASAKVHVQNDTTTNITFVKIHSVEKLERFLKCVK